MRIINVIALLCVSVSLTILLTSYILNKPSVTSELRPATSVNKGNTSPEKTRESVFSNNKEHDKADEQFTHSVTENLDTEDEPNKYSHLTDHQSIDAFFFNVQGELKAGAVKTVLTTDIKDFIEHISELPLDNEQASRRQGLLNQQLLALKDSNIYDQRIACAGNACILSLITDELTAEGKAHLAEFDSNISFISANTNDAGELEFNAIYLYDEDPSHLVIASP
ncbi:hypothetical protein [Shewanella kaireitica]|uniref:hypothetical protein n=1 Tax=Shewanella kaireitica TaxID=212021 RepID=UPI00200C9739|nr:hypothetical protein [Shewanella kaireitica]MCL1095580.1 hypothetical protein [Shewanella kaireitica]